MAATEPRVENALYRADALALLERLPHGYADLIYLDPPLVPGSVLTSGTDELAQHLTWIGQVFEECQRCLAPGGSLVLQLPARATAGYRMLLDWLFGWDGLRDEIVWVYERSGASKVRRAHDLLLFYANKVAGDIGSSGLVHKRQRVNLPRSSVWEDIPRLDTTVGLRLAAQRPLPLLERIVETASPPTGLVLDPFMGAGGSLVAAARLGRRWLGCDILQDAFAAAVDQLRTVVDDIDARSADQESLERAPLLHIPNAAPVKDLVNQALASGVSKPNSTFVYEQVASEEEDRTTEFKTVNGHNPVDSISTVAEKYSVGFLNGEGGSVYWGIRDDRTVVGVALTATQRDQVRQGINNRLATIQPPILPDAFRISFHPVLDGPMLQERWVIELRVPAPAQRSLLFSTGRDEVFIRVDGITKKLTMVQVQEWVRRSERAQQILDRAA